MKDTLLKILFSTRLTAVLFILFPTAMALERLLRLGILLIRLRFGFITLGGLSYSWHL